MAHVYRKRHRWGWQVETEHFIPLVVSVSALYESRQVRNLNAWNTQHWCARAKWSITVVFIFSLKGRWIQRMLDFLKNFPWRVDWGSNSQIWIWPNDEITRQRHNKSWKWNREERVNWCLRHIRVQLEMTLVRKFSKFSSHILARDLDDMLMKRSAIVGTSSFLKYFLSSLFWKWASHCC